LNKPEATNLLRETILACEGLTAETIPDLGNLLSHEYPICIKPIVTQRNFQHTQSEGKNTGFSVIDKQKRGKTVFLAL
jgi:hypothetical protein